MTYNNKISTPVNKTINRLAKVCGMLGSAHDGERAAAALLASQILEDIGVSWSDLIHSAYSNANEAAKPSNVEFDPRQPGWHVPYCEWLLANKMSVLSKWDVDFLVNIKSKYGSVLLTKKQSDIVIKLASKHGLEV